MSAVWAGIFCSSSILRAVDYVDPQGGGDYYAAGSQLSHEVDLNGGNASASVPAIPYFEDVFPFMAGIDYTGESATQAIYSNEWAPYRGQYGDNLAVGYRLLLLLRLPGRMAIALRVPRFVQFFVGFLCVEAVGSEEGAGLCELSMIGVEIVEERHAESAPTSLTFASSTAGGEAGFTTLHINMPRVTTAVIAPAICPARMTGADSRFSALPDDVARSGSGMVAIGKRTAVSAADFVRGRHHQRAHRRAWL